MIRGALILESLRPGSHLAGLRLTVREISRFEPGGTTADQPSTWSVTETFVVFPGRVFRYPRRNQAGRAAAEAHGRLLSIPEQQLDWPT
jgi:hypothetical protein